MHCPKCFRPAALLMLLALFASTTSALPQDSPEQRATENRSTINNRRLIKAFVVDDRLSALRREPDFQSAVMRRLQLGRAVYIVESRRGAGNTTFYRVAVTRRTRGWLHASALALPTRPGDDRRLMSLAESAGDGLDRIMLCRIFVEHFNRSALLPRALLQMAEEADRASGTLTQRARKRLADVDPRSANASQRDYYLNDSGLDRYSRLRVVFNFNETTAEYVYDGRAYRDIIKRFPNTEEATLAHRRLALVEQKLAGQK